MQSWNLKMKSSTVGVGAILFLSMNWFGIRRSILALIMCGCSSSLSVSLNLGLGWTTNGEHHVTGSPSGTSSKMSSSIHCSSLRYTVLVVFVSNRQLVLAFEQPKPPLASL